MKAKRRELTQRSKVLWNTTGTEKILTLRRTIRMTPWEYSIALATTPAIVVYLREAVRQLLGRKASAVPSRLVRVEYGKGESQERVYGCFDAAVVRR